MTALLLHKAVEQNNAVEVSRLLDAKADPNARHGEDMMTPLQTCYSNNYCKWDLRVARLLLAAGADINCTDKCGDTPLFLLAYQSVSYAHFKLLDQCALDLTIQDELGNTMVHNVIMEAHLPWLEYLIGRYPDQVLYDQRAIERALDSMEYHVLLTLLSMHPGWNVHPFMSRRRGQRRNILTGYHMQQIGVFFWVGLHICHSPVLVQYFQQHPLTDCHLEEAFLSYLLVY